MVVTTDVYKRDAMDVLYKDNLNIWKFFWRRKPKRVLVVPIYDDSIEFWPLSKEEITKELKEDVKRTKQIDKSNFICISEM